MAKLTIEYRIKHFGKDVGEPLDHYPSEADILERMEKNGLTNLTVSRHFIYTPEPLDELTSEELELNMHSAHMFAFKPTTIGKDSPPFVPPFADVTGTEPAVGGHLKELTKKVIAGKSLDNGLAMDESVRERLMTELAAKMYRYEALCGAMPSVIVMGPLAMDALRPLTWDNDTGTHAVIRKYNGILVVTLSVGDPWAVYVGG